MSANPPGVTIVFFAVGLDDASAAPLGMLTSTKILDSCSLLFTPLTGWMCGISVDAFASSLALTSLLSSARDFSEDDARC